jgi:hypothetical protein
MEIMVSEISQTEANIARSLSYMESKPKKEWHGYEEGW